MPILTRPEPIAPNLLENLEPIFPKQKALVRLASGNGGRTLFASVLLLSLRRPGGAGGPAACALACSALSSGEVGAWLRSASSCAVVLDRTPFRVAARSGFCRCQPCSWLSKPALSGVIPAQ